MRAARPIYGCEGCIDIKVKTRPGILHVYLSKGIEGGTCMALKARWHKVLHISHRDINTHAASGTRKIMQNQFT